MSEKIKFFHMADLHLGAFREKTLTNLNFKTFQKAIEIAIEEKPEFILFAGDIFNNAMPPLELVNSVANELMKLKENNIELFVIGGSHDYSTNQKSYIELLETTKILTDVSKYEMVGKNEVNLKFFNYKNKVTISGILGKKNGLDKNIYKNLNEQTLDKSKYNIFMFHTTLNDFKPDFLKNVNSSVTSSHLPKGFDYYAGGHVHTHIEGSYHNKPLSYPGPLFPNNFSELKRETPSFNICEFNFETKQTKITRKYIKTYEKIHIKITVNDINPFEAREKIEKELNEAEIENKILLLEIDGVVNGKISDIKLNDIISNLYEKSPIHILKNTSKLTSSSIIANIEEIETSTEDITEKILNEMLGNIINKENKKEIVENLLKLELNKQEGEKISQHEERIKTAFNSVLDKYQSQT